MAILQSGRQLPSFAVFPCEILIGFGQIRDFHGRGIPEQFFAAESQGDGCQIEGIRNRTAQQEVAVSGRPSLESLNPGGFRLLLGVVPVLLWSRGSAFGSQEIPKSPFGNDPRAFTFESRRGSSRGPPQTSSLRAAHERCLLPFPEGWAGGFPHHTRTGQRPGGYPWRQS